MYFNGSAVVDPLVVAEEQCKAEERKDTHFELLVKGRVTIEDVVPLEEVED